MSVWCDVVLCLANTRVKCGISFGLSVRVEKCTLVLYRMCRRKRRKGGSKCDGKWVQHNKVERPLLGKASGKPPSPSAIFVQNKRTIRCRYIFLIQCVCKNGRTKIPTPKCTSFFSQVENVGTPAKCTYKPTSEVPNPLRKTHEQLVYNELNFLGGGKDLGNRRALRCGPLSASRGGRRSSLRLKELLSRSLQLG